MNDICDETACMNDREWRSIIDGELVCAQCPRALLNQQLSEPRK